MTYLPIPDWRVCLNCEYAWFTAYTGECECPGCGVELDAVVGGWPHACQSGHESDRGGECARCSPAVEVAVTKESVLWVDRT